MIAAHPSIKGEARLRRKNQLTLPEAIAEAMQAHPDDILVFETDALDPTSASVRILPRSFAGAMTGIYGTTDEVLAYLHEEREAWEESRGR